MARFDQKLVRRTGKVWMRQGGNALCEVCGFQESCQLRAALAPLGKTHGATIMVPECASYMPVVSFADHTGVCGRFNTFRRGRGWARRVELGTLVGLYDLASNRVIGQARVTAIHVGPLATLLPAHAAANHLMKTLTAGQADALQRVLVRLYGKTYAAPEQDFSALYFEETEWTS